MLPEYLIADIPVEFELEEFKTVNKLVETFANACKSTYYSKHRYADPEKSEKDAILGKRAEWMVAAVLIDQFGYPDHGPDLAVYRGNDKSWAADLIAENFPIVHVKSCDKTTRNICNDFSWTFQLSNANGRGGRDPVLDSGDYCAFVFLEGPWERTGMIKAILPMHMVRPLLKDPARPKYHGIKTCLYYRDIAGL